MTGIGAFANALGGPFVFDDKPAILENLQIRQLSAALATPSQSAVAGRPIVNLSLAVNYALGGFDPLGYHAWNLAVHVAAALLLYGIVRRTCAARRAPEAIRSASSGLGFASALIWLVHPLQTEVIDYVTQRTESMMGLFYLLTLYAAIRAISGPANHGRWTVLAVAACALGMACKEPMVTAPLIVLLYDAVFGAGSIKRAWQERRPLYVGLGFTWCLLAALIASGPRWRSAGFASGVSPWTYLLNQSEMILTYLKLTVWPAPLVLDYGMTPPRTLAGVLPAAIVVLALLVSTALAWMKWPALAYVGTWFWITLAPSSSVVPVATEVGAERRMYLPLAALAVLGVLAVHERLGRLFSDTVLRRRTAAALLACGCGMLVWITVRRNAEYRSEIGIWQTVVERRPHGRAHYNLGLALTEAGRRDEAVGHYRLAIDDEPKAHYALGFELEKMGRYQEAIREYELFVRRSPDDVQTPQGYSRLGFALLREGKFPEAVGALEQALRMRPQGADARAAYADALMQQGRHREAAREYAEYIRLAPTDAAAHERLGLALVAQNLESDAVPAFEKAVSLAPSDAGKRLGLANALAASGRQQEAVQQYRQGLALAPNSPTLHAMLGMTLAALGNPKEGLAELEQAVALGLNDPQLRAAHAALKQALTRDGV